jgi:hypothetical protein
MPQYTLSITTAKELRDIKKMPILFYMSSNNVLM